MRSATSITLRLALLALSLPLPASSAQPNPSTTRTQSADTTSSSIEFTFDRPGLPVPHFTLTVWENRQGQYRGYYVEPATPSDPPPSPQPFDQKFAISPATTAKIFTLSSKLKQFNSPCASLAKNMASTGKKTLRYTAAGATPSSCTYDYSENKDVQALTAIFHAIAETMDQGRKLDTLHRYDRLGLDQAMIALAGELSAGRAIELTTIAPSLQSIAEDPEVMQRVRARAAALLSTLPAQTPSP